MPQLNRLDEMFEAAEARGPEASHKMALQVAFMGLYSLLDLIAEGGVIMHERRVFVEAKKMLIHLGMAAGIDHDAALVIWRATLADLKDAGRL